MEDWVGGCWGQPFRSAPLWHNPLEPAFSVMDQPYTSHDPAVADRRRMQMSLQFFGRKRVWFEEEQISNVVRQRISSNEFVKSSHVEELCGWVHGARLPPSVAHKAIINSMSQL